MQKNKVNFHFLESSNLIRKSLVSLRSPVQKAAELVGRYLKDRKSFPAISLSTDTSALTAIGNDYGFEKVFSRQVEALVRPEDVLVCISTSGKKNWGQSLGTER